MEEVVAMEDIEDKIFIQRQSWTYLMPQSVASNEELS